MRRRQNKSRRARVHEPIGQSFVLFVKGNRLRRHRTHRLLGAWAPWACAGRIARNCAPAAAHCSVCVHLCLVCTARCVHWRSVCGGAYVSSPLECALSFSFTLSLKVPMVCLTPLLLLPIAQEARARAHVAHLCRGDRRTAARLLLDRPLRSERGAARLVGEGVANGGDKTE